MNPGSQQSFVQTSIETFFFGSLFISNEEVSEKMLDELANFLEQNSFPT